MWNDRHISGLLLVIAILFAACGKTPRGVLSEKEMQKVVTDMLLAEAMIAVSPQDFTTDSAKIRLYQSVFDRHHVTQSLYDSSLVWYGKNLDIYMKLYERVVADFNLQIADLGDVQADAAPVSTNDSVDLWPRRTFMVLHAKAVFNGVRVDVRPETFYPSGSTFVMGMNVWGLPDSLHLYPIVKLTALLTDTVITVSDTIRQNGHHRMVLQTPATKPTQRLYGFIWMNNRADTTDYSPVYIDRINLIRYNYGSKALKFTGIGIDAAPADSVPTATAATDTVPDT